MIKVGKKLHASYTCPNCHNQMLISKEERQQGKLNFKPNFFLHDRNTKQVYSH